MFNAYPDSIGSTLADTVKVLQHPELRDAFSLFYVLPTFFNSDLDRGFSVIDYDRNEALVSEADLEAIKTLGIGLKFDLVVNHLSVGSPQFRDLLLRGDTSDYRDFFIDWNEFWQGHGEMGSDGHVVPQPQHLDKLFMRKPELPILDVRFPDGKDRPYWNTFYQQVTYDQLNASDFKSLQGVSDALANEVADALNRSLAEGRDWREVPLGALNHRRSEIHEIVESKRRYLGQMDLNARSEKVWQFYDETLAKLAAFGARLIRLDAFAYLHKEPGESNFFNKPGTWDYLHRIRQLAHKRGLVLLPEIHGEYGRKLHEEVAGEGYPIYDFFFPGLIIDALDRATNGPLLRWVREMLAKNMRTINMLGCHDGIPVLDLNGKTIDGQWREGLLGAEELEAVVQRIIDRGGRVKNLYGADGKKISYYQVNATFFSALGEDQRSMRLARAIQLFMPGIPQVWYLDLFMGTNDYAAADRGGAGGHKEINRTTLSIEAVQERLQWPIVRDQLDLIRLRNTCSAFDGELEIGETAGHELDLTWRHGDAVATLRADLQSGRLDVAARDGGAEIRLSYD